MTTITVYQPQQPRLTFDQWRRHIQRELFATQQRNLQYRLMEVATGNHTIKAIQK